MRKLLDRNEDIIFAFMRPKYQLNKQSSIDELKIMERISLLDSELIAEYVDDLRNSGDY